MRYPIIPLLALAALCRADLVSDTRDLASKGNLDGSVALVQKARAKGDTGETLLASSWIARSALAQKKYDRAAAVAKETYTRVRASLQRLPIEKDPEGQVALALGASIEVQGQAMAAQGARGDALAYLQHELDLYKTTSIRARIQKNINMLGLEGQSMPALRGMSVQKGKPTLVFFWAHWCTDCRAEAPILTKLKNEFPNVAFLGPTQKYGYTAAKGTNAPPAEESKHIEEIRQQYYARLVPPPAVVNEENFASWGVSTVPTLVAIDKAGKVAKYHPGQMTEAELRTALQAISR